LEREERHMTSFKEWVKQKTDDAASIERSKRVTDWVHACLHLRTQVEAWLTEEGEGRIKFDLVVVDRTEHGLGSYSLHKLRINIGEDSVELIPLGRNVIGSYGLRGEPEHRGAGRVDLTNGIRKYMLYRTIQSDKDVWYVVDERGEFSLLTKDRLLEIVRDLMS
jgi:hypothetical protein